MGTIPPAVAERFAEEGARWIHVVDLDRAFGDGRQRRCGPTASSDRVERPGCGVQLGGGFRTLGPAREGLELGIARAVIGTAAAIDPGVRARGRWRVAARSASPSGIDARDGHGRGARLDRDVHDSAPRSWRGAWCREGIETVIYTDVTRDGMLARPRPGGRASRCRAGRPGDRERRRDGTAPTSAPPARPASRAPSWDGRCTSERLDPRRGPRGGSDAQLALVVLARRGARRVHLSRSRADSGAAAGSRSSAARSPGRHSVCCCST